MNKISWSEFKLICNSKLLNIQSNVGAGAYYLEAWDGPKKITSSILISDPKEVEQIDFENNYLPKCNKVIVGANSAFASKLIGYKKLFRRKHGYKFTLDASGIGSLIIVVPYNFCKINELEIIGCKPLDKLNLKILDRVVSPLYGVPSANLNQFGFDVLTPLDFYKDKSEYDADLIKDMQVEVTYTSLTPSIEIGVNIVFHEIK